MRTSRSRFPLLRWLIPNVPSASLDPQHTAHAQKQTQDKVGHPLSTLSPEATRSNGSRPASVTGSCLSAMQT